MNKLLIFLTVFSFTLISCGGNDNNTTAPSAQTNSEDKPVENTSSTEDKKETTAYDYSGTWTDAKTGEILTFDGQNAYWSKGDQADFVKMELAEEKMENNEVRFNLYFSNKKDKPYTMVYAFEASSEAMECFDGDKKLNDYKRISPNKHFRNGHHVAKKVSKQMYYYNMSENPATGNWEDPKTKEYMSIDRDAVLWSKKKGDKAISLGIAKYHQLDDSKPYTVDVFFRDKPDVVYRMILKDDQHLECWQGKKKLNEYLKS